MAANVRTTISSAKIYLYELVDLPETRNHFIRFRKDVTVVLCDQLRPALPIDFAQLRWVVVAPYSSIRSALRWRPISSHSFCAVRLFLHFLLLTALGIPTGAEDTSHSITQLGAHLDNLISCLAQSETGISTTTISLPGRQLSCRNLQR